MSNCWFGKLICAMQKYDRHSKVSIDIVFAAVKEFIAEHSIDLNKPEKITGERSAKNKIRKTVEGIPVRLASLRMLTFYKTGITCHCCGLKATHFAFERGLVDANTNKPYHLNLWADTPNGEILFTHDHILAKANNGADNLSNTQTMCVTCNNEKGCT